VLLEWLYINLEEELGQDIMPLAHNFPAGLQSGPTNVSLKMTFFTLRDILECQAEYFVPF
jgi:hypothetical protein